MVQGNQRKKKSGSLQEAKKKGRMSRNREDRDEELQVELERLVSGTRRITEEPFVLCG